MTTTSALPLFAWLSPTFPVGAYAYSHGLEWSVEIGDIRDEASLLDWLRDVLIHGAGRNDAIFLAETHRAAALPDFAKVFEINELALAFTPSQELRLETAQQGRSFLDAVLAAWPNESLTRAAEGFDEIAYPVAVGLAAAAHGIALGAVTPPFLLAFAQNLVSAAIRCAPIGQTAGTRILSSLIPAINELSASVENLSLDHVGSCVFRADLGSFHHETQYSRLFRS